jgi:hypothetical protein
MFWRLREFFKDKTKDDMVIIRGFIEPIVRAAICKQEESNSNEKDEASLLDHLVNVTDGMQFPFVSAPSHNFPFLDMKIIVDEVLNM